MIYLLDAHASPYSESSLNADTYHVIRDGLLMALPARCHEFSRFTSASGNLYIVIWVKRHHYLAIVLVTRVHVRSPLTFRATLFMADSACRTLYVHDVGAQRRSC
jgi:hypothetical protein